jgi:hypothetical protein
MIEGTELDQLVERWSIEAAALRERYDSPQLAHLTMRHADELRAAIAASGNQLVTLRQGARICGYTDDHLGRLVRSGALANYGRTHAPKLRVSDLPQKPKALRDATSRNTHSPRKRIVLAARNG